MGHGTYQWFRAKVIRSRGSLGVILAVLSLWGCGAWLQVDPVELPPEPDSRAQYRVWTPDASFLLTSVAVRNDSIQGELLACPEPPISCKVAMEIAQVDSIQIRKSDARTAIWLNVHILIASLVFLFLVQPET